MTVSFTSVQDSFRTAVLSAGTNTNVIFFFPNGPQPQLPFTTIRTLSIGREVNDWDVFDKADNKNKIYGFRDVSFSINTYGQNALHEASILQGNLKKQSISEALRSTVSMCIRQLSGINDLTQLVDAEFQERASFDVFLNVNIEDGTTEEDLGYFNAVDPVIWTDKPTT